jgi:hypothetical protein
MRYYAMPVSVLLHHLMTLKKLFPKMINLDQASFFSQSNSFVFQASSFLNPILQCIFSPS